MRPIIGVFAEVDLEQNTKVQNTYIRAIEESGGIPILLPYVKDRDTMERFVNLCDGFFFTGGADIEPQRYGEQSKNTCGEIQYARDELEFAVFQIVNSTLKPIIAICRGAQLINVAFGGTLYQDILSETNTRISHRQIEPKNSPSHDVQILKNTPLFDLMKKTVMSANSFHHQAIKKLGEGLEIMAVSDDGIVEAVYLPGERYVRAYQWHPERLYEIDIYNRLIFDDFIKACQNI
ncbi:MAG: gamma-glutamyl-gamma-aminobutyrate hydrolase family protein [Clostridia bacterium]|nr:gamma-glutamyl-gamma-aminobutyrate hydrolase family protein [Clostridia bacterium]